MSLVVLDTDVASASLRERLPVSLAARLTGRTASITFVTWGELVKWTAIRSWGPRRRASLESWRSRVVLLPYSELVATAWGELQARARMRGRPRPVNDTWIAACCLVDQLPLATFNTKDFADFAEHDGLQLFDTR
ncbi:MAG: PIN domain-containing protein [Propionibacteriales bacterium]|nr:PIN domain-containing protein [Propionibacteriales bacterium]